MLTLGPSCPYPEILVNTTDAGRSLGPRPNDSATPGRKFSITTSTFCASLRTALRPPSVFRSAATHRRLRPYDRHHSDVPVPSSTRSERSGSPPPRGGSTLMTSAPK